MRPHVPGHDLEVAGPTLAAALDADVGYIGALGSRRTQQARAEWLEPAWLWPLVCIPFCALLILETLGRGPLNSEDVLTSN